MKSGKHTFFCENINDLTLPKEECHHAFKVLRLKNNDTINIMDGKGSFAICTIESISKNELHYKIIELLFEKPKEYSLHIAIAPTKSNERIEFFLEKVTEIGIDEITPIITSNSERKVVKIERWEKIIKAAVKQSKNLYFPKLNEPINFNKFVEEQKSNIGNYIAHCEDDSDKLFLSDEVNKINNQFCVLIGPEGDFTTQEIEFAKEQNYKPVSIGPSRLRTETAGIVACHTINLIKSF